MHYWDMVVEWMKAGSIPHYVWLLVVLYVIEKDVLPKSKWKPNGITELIFNQLNKVLLPIFGRFPFLGEVLASLDTPAPVPPPLPPPPDGNHP